MSTIYYGEQKDFNWRLGDTSTRYKNQIAFNEFLLEQCFHHDEGLNDNEIYQLMYQNGYKRKSQASKKGDSGLAINTLKSLELVDKQEKKYFITPKGRDFYQLLNNQPFDQDSIMLFKAMHVQLKDLLWLTYLFQLVVNQKGEKEYAPFIYLIKQLIENNLEEKDFLKKWTLFRQEPGALPINNPSINPIKEYWEINTSKSNNIKEFFEHFKSKTLNEAVLTKLLSSNEKAFKENLKLILDGDENLHQKYLDKVKRNIPAYLLNKPDFIRDALTYLNKFSYEDLCTIYQNNKHYITAEKEYANINKYWLNGIKVFLFEAGMLKIRSINKVIFSYLFEQIGVKENEHLDFEKTSSYFLDETKVKEIITMLIGQGFDLKVEGQEADVNLPYSRDDVKNFLGKINDYLTDENLFYDFKQQNQLESIPKPTIVEYFINLYVYYVFLETYQLHPSEFNFSLMCNTILDNSFRPTSHAGGNQPDGFIKYNDKVYVIETTLIDNVIGLTKNELEPIQRHLFNCIDQDKEKIASASLLFFAPKYFKNFLTKFFRISEDSYYVKETEQLSPQKYHVTSNPYKLDNNFIKEGLDLRVKNLDSREKLVKEKYLKSE